LDISDLKLNKIFLSRLNNVEVPLSASTINHKTFLQLSKFLSLWTERATLWN